VDLMFQENNSGGTGSGRRRWKKTNMVEVLQKDSTTFVSI
jgi:hypothetical protein